MWRSARGPGWRSRRRLRFTREGRVFVLTSIGIGLAAVNTGSNMLYLVLGVFLALVIVSGVLSEWMLWHVSVRRLLPARVFAGEPYAVEIELRNERGAYPIVAVEVEDLRENAPADKRCFFLRVAPGGSQVAVYRRTTKSRGALAFSGFRVVTRFPFGFFEKSVAVDAPQELVVYPAIVRDGVSADGSKDAESGAQAVARGAGQETLGFREALAGDGVRDIAWKLSARGVGLVAHDRGGALGASDVVEFAEASAGPGFEAEVSRCASLLVRAVGQGGSLTLSFRGRRFLATPGAGLDEALRELALAAPTVSRETPFERTPLVSRETSNHEPATP